MSHPSHGYGEPKCASGVGFGHMHPGRTLVGGQKRQKLKGPGRMFAAELEHSHS